MSVPNLSFFVPTYQNFNVDQEQLRILLIRVYTLITFAINNREVSVYENFEIPTGQKFFVTGNNNQVRDVFRTVVVFGALPNAATKSVAHNITFSSSLEFVNIYGTSKNTVTNVSIAIPHINVAAPADSVQITVDNTNVNITTTTANYVNNTITTIILEYIKDQ